MICNSDTHLLHLSFHILTVAPFSLNPFHFSQSFLLMINSEFLPTFLLTVSIKVKSIHMTFSLQIPKPTAWESDILVLMSLIIYWLHMLPLLSCPEPHKAKGSILIY